MAVADRHIGALTAEVVPGEAWPVRFVGLAGLLPGAAWSAAAGRAPAYPLTLDVEVEGADVVVTFPAEHTAEMPGNPWRLRRDGLDLIGGLVAEATPQSTPGEASVTVVLADESEVQVTVVGGGGSSALAGLTDVDLDGLSPPQVLGTLDGETWVPVDPGGGVGLSDETPAALGTAGAGTGGEAARDDHVHPMPTAADIGAATAEQGGLADSAVQSDDLASVATSGDYGDLENKPAIPASPGDIGAVSPSRQITAGHGLDGGGDLTTDRELSVEWGTGTDQVRRGDDAAYTDARTPTAHADTHGVGGADEVQVDLAQLATTGTPDGTKFLRDDGAWTAPPSGGADLSDETPAALGTAVPGTGGEAARDDHVHPMPAGSDIEVDAPGVPPGSSVDDFAVGVNGAFVSAFSEIQSIKTGVPLLDRDAPGETRWTFTAPEVEMTAAARLALDLDFWPDGNMDLDLGSFKAFGPNGPNTARWNPDFGTGGIVSSVDATTIGISGHTYDYASIGQVFRHPDHPTVLLGIVHVERDYTTPTADAWYRASIGIARSTDNGSTWAYLGDIITHNRPWEDNSHRNWDIGPGTKVWIGDYLYVFFQEHRADGRSLGLSLARCHLDDLAVAASSSTLPEFDKWDGQTWDEPGLGGLAGNIMSFDSPWNPASFACYRTKHALEPVGDGDEPHVFVYSVVDNGRWALFLRTFFDPRHLSRSTQITEWSDDETLYVSVFPADTNQVTVYFTQSTNAASGLDRWADADVNRITLTYHPTPDVYIATGGKGFVNHGSNAATPRPTQFASVEWLGTVEPDNWIDVDTWINPS